MTKPELQALHDKLMSVTNSLSYDHRPRMLDHVKTKWPHMMEDCQLQYARFKKAVTMVLKPATIYEIGVGWGVSALALIDGYQQTLFHGIDNNDIGYDVAETLLGLGTMDAVASDTLPQFKHPSGLPIDLIHVDGGHEYQQKQRDIVKALEAQPEWLLVDDVHNVMVAAGTFYGLYRAGPTGLDMLYFPDSHTGNLLVHIGRKPCEYRNV